jgi:hypothetical protein
MIVLCIKTGRQNATQQRKQEFKRSHKSSKIINGFGLTADQALQPEW